MSEINKTLPVVNTIRILIEKYNKKYCFPSQIKLLKLLEKYYGQKRHISSLNRWLRIAEDQKLIKRKRRIKRGLTGCLEFKSTLYWMTIKGWNTLFQKGYDVREKLKKILAEIARKKRLVRQKADENNAYAKLFEEVKKCGIPDILQKI